MRTNMLTLNIGKEVPVTIPRRKLERLFEVVITAERSRRRRGDINLVFTSPERLRQLNYRFRGRNRTTDVLSFNLEKGAVDDPVFGEIYISVATARRQAVAAGVTLQREILHLSCHGLLHLLGYDHEVSTEAERRMLSRQNLYVQRAVTGD